MVENEDLTLTLPFPPSVNHYWRHCAQGRSGNVRVYITTKGREFREQVCRIVRGKGLAIGLDAPLAVSIVLRPPDRMRRDLDNYGGKALLDAITKSGLWLDDSQVRELNIKWGSVIKGGETQIQIGVLQ